MRPNIRIPFVCLAGLCWGLLGCHPAEDPIVSYTVPKHDAIQIPVETPKRAETDTLVKGRMLAAFLIAHDEFWSFKALASPEDFPEGAVADFDSLVKSLSFPAGKKPTWDLGERWKELPGAGMRVANLMLDDLEFSVVKLRVSEGADRQAYLLQNVNRWRKQLNLPDVGQSEIADLPTRQTQDGHEAMILDISGMFAGDASPPMGRRSAPTSTTPPQSTSFTDSPPEHWAPTAAGMMQLATYQIETDGKSAKVSISRAGGDKLANINRWRRQVGMAPLSRIDDAKLQDISVSNVAGSWVEIPGDSGQSIVVAMLPADRPTWFFKLQGDSQLVQNETNSFRTYLGTIQLNSQ